MYCILGLVLMIIGFLIVIICGIIINRKDIIKDEKGT